MICGPVMTSSPSSPTGSSFSPVSMSTILESVSGQGRPMLPIFTVLSVGSSGLQCVTGEDSVRP